ncbi:MAG TPA: hypothetical protein VFC07_06120, partial [Verrucomicrobiae bacterium]|nr:hypothetical protein [Verrucomicrobiae bacterium]
LTGWPVEGTQQFPNVPPHSAPRRNRLVQRAGGNFSPPQAIGRVVLRNASSVFQLLDAGSVFRFRPIA